MSEELSPEYAKLTSVFADAAIHSILTSIPQDCAYSPFNIALNTLIIAVIKLSYEVIPKENRTEFIVAIGKQINLSYKLSDKENEEK